MDDPSANEGAGEDAAQSVPSRTGSGNPLPSRKSASPRRFRFVMGASKPRKRRKASNPSRNKNAVAPGSTLEAHHSSTGADILATAGENLQLPNADQASSHTHDELGSDDLIVPSPNLPTSLGEDANLFDSLDQGESSTAGILDNIMALSATPPFNAMGTTEENALDNRDQLDPLTLDLGSTLVESAQSDVLNTARNNLHINEIDMSYTSPSTNTFGLSNIFKNDHDDLLRMCMVCTTIFKKLRLTRIQMTPSFAYSR